MNKLNNNILNAIRNKTVKPSVAVREITDDFRALASKTLRRCGHPTTVDLDDVVQEMLIEMFRSIARFEPGLGDFKSYVVFNSMTAAKKFIRREHRFKTFEGPDSLVSDVQEAVQDSHAIFNEGMQHMESMLHSERQTAILRSLAETQCVNRTTEQLLADPRTSLLFQRDDFASTRWGVYQTVRKMTKIAASLGR
jgi:DNA-directed RNA polymerase specialized sigma24 family protein